MCDANSYIEGTIIQAEIDNNGYFWLSEGSGQSRYYQKSGSTNRAYPQEGCVSCPTPTPLPATATPVPATATPLPATATPIPATPLPATATPVPEEATPTPTNTPPPATSYAYQLGPSYTSSSLACQNYGMDFYTTVYAAADQPFNVEQFFTDPNLVTVYTGENETHAFSLNSVGATPYSGNISYTGIVSNKSFCAEAP